MQLLLPMNRHYTYMQVHGVPALCTDNELLRLVMGDLAADRPAWWRWAYLGLWQKLKSAANDLPYTSQVALGLFGQCNGLKPAKSLIVSLTIMKH